MLPVHSALDKVHKYIFKVYINQYKYNINIYYQTNRFNAVQLIPCMFLNIIVPLLTVVCACTVLQDEIKIAYADTRTVGRTIKNV